ncbi:MFS transporter [Kitasatospora atroaurantiaca]|uniref:Putative MFS family arabinose efflux permease n=1 Tax=Kitasatospora atroaurantiaca TaxID=285545 RepID=A0A561ETE8_9ACTN|nr:MFS transporter [Kitasatospora atroaurantiaca]TWE18867.1 putative MFS family arabinose efflux permease [Kitasatospora atroaurantiaca]
MAESGVLRTNRDFRRFWVGSALSTLGSQMSLIAFPLLVLSLGGGAAQAGLVASCSLVTRMLFRLPAGQLADRMDRRRLMLGADLVRLVTVGSIPLAAGLGHLGYPHLLVVAVIEGIATAVFSPASTIAVRDVVPEEQLSDALAKDQAALAAASLIGPFLGGWLFTVDRILPFTADAASYAVSAVLLLRMVTKPPQPAEGEKADNSPTAGLRWLARQPALLRALAFGALLNLVGSSAEVAMVVTLRGSGTGGTSIGLVMACAGVGAVLGSLAAPQVMKLLKPGQLFLTIGAVWSGGLAAFAVTQQPWVLGPLLVLLILLTPPAGIVVGQALLSQSPRELLGRVSTAANLLIAGLAALGPVVTGAALEGLGISPTWLVLAGLIAAATLVAALPMLRDTGLAPERQEQERSSEPAAA